MSVQIDPVAAPLLVLAHVDSARQRDVDLEVGDAALLGRDVVGGVLDLGLEDAVGKQPGEGGLRAAGGQDGPAGLDLDAAGDAHAGGAVVGDEDLLDG